MSLTSVFRSGVVRSGNCLAATGDVAKNDTSTITTTSGGNTPTTTASRPPTFRELGMRHGTDKVTHHRYDRFYPREIDHIKPLVGVGMIEIGLFRGASLNVWLDYLPNAWIYGLDINNEATGDRVTIVKGDQSVGADLNRLIGALRHPIHFVNDDGSHVPEHQLFTFRTLFPIVENGGVYIIEDIETGYWTRGGLYGYETRYGPEHRLNLVNVFGDLVTHYVNREFLTLKALDRLVSSLVALGFETAETVDQTTGQRCVPVLDSVASVTIAHNCVIIRKVDSNEDSNVTSRQPYRGSMYL